MAQVLIDHNIYLKVTSGGWNMKKDSVTTARKRLERYVCLFVMRIFFAFSYVEGVFQSHETINATVQLVYLLVNQNFNISILRVVWSMA